LHAALPIYTIGSERQLVETLLHETFHYGIKPALGSRYDAMMDDIAARRRNDVSRKARQYGLDTRIPAQRRKAAEEVIASLAETDPDMPLVKRLVAAVRDFFDAIAGRLGF